MKIRIFLHMCYTYISETGDHRQEPVWGFLTPTSAYLSSKDGVEQGPIVEYVPS